MQLRIKVGEGSSKRIANLLRFASLTLIWGSGFFWIKISLRGFGPGEIVAGRMLIAAFSMWLVALTSRLPLPRSPSIWFHLTIMAILANLIPYYLLAWAELRVASSVAAVLNATVPLFTLLFNVMLRVEVTSWNRWLGALIGFTGVIILAQPWGTKTGGSTIGIVACLAVAICYAGSYVYSHHFLAFSGYSAIALSAGQFISGGVLASLSIPFLVGNHMGSSLEAILGVFVLGGVCSGVAYILNYGLIRDRGASAASMVTHAVPVVAVVLGVLILNEMLSSTFFVGGGVVLVGVWLVEGRADHLNKLELQARRLLGRLRHSHRVPTALR
jgi:drug/metabolite transporter (DMT)-like permease